MAKTKLLKNISFIATYLIILCSTSYYLALKLEEYNAENTLYYIDISDSKLLLIALGMLIIAYVLTGWVFTLIELILKTWKNLK